MSDETKQRKYDGKLIANICNPLKSINEFLKIAQEFETNLETERAILNPEHHEYLINSLKTIKQDMFVAICTDLSSYFAQTAPPKEKKEIKKEGNIIYHDFGYKPPDEEENEQPDEDPTTS